MTVATVTVASVIVRAVSVVAVVVIVCFAHGFRLPRPVLPYPSQFGFLRQLSGCTMHRLSPNHSPSQGL